MTPFGPVSSEASSVPSPEDKELRLRKLRTLPGSNAPNHHQQQQQPRSTLISHASEVPGPSYPFPHASTGGQRTSLQSVLQLALKPFHRARKHVDGFTLLDWLQVFLPCVRWLRIYRIRDFLLWDIIAGISVGFMVVPQGMSYASIAGVPSVYGLYGAFLPVLVYAVFGSSRELAVGPVAVTSLLISSALKDVVPGSADITNPNSPPLALVGVQQQYNHLAIQLSLLVACMYTAVGVLNLGFLTNFLSHSVLGGFTSGAAVIIALSQAKFLLGYNVPRSTTLHEQVRDLIKGAGGFIWQEYVMGITMLTMLLTIKYFGKRYTRLKWLRPLGPITACIVGIIAVAAGGLQHRGIKIVGRIPAGLPKPTVEWWFPMDNVTSLLPLAVVVMLVDLLESTSIARALAVKGHYDLNPNQEIVGLGLANFAGAAFNAYSTTGSISRSAVNYDSGAKTGLAGFVTGCVVGLVLLVMTPVFELLPFNVMGAIVISGVSGLFEYEEAVYLFKVRKLDWAVWMCSFLSTMFIGVEIGLAISIGLAMIIVIYESAFPHTALLGRVGRTTIYRNVKQFPDSQVIPGIAACRVDAPMYFANVQYIRDRLRKYVERAQAYSTAAGVQLQWFLLDMSPVTHLDSTGAHLLEGLYTELYTQGIQLGLCNPACTVVSLLERTGFPDTLGREWFFVRMHDAVQTCLAAMVAEGQAVRPFPASESFSVAPRRVEAMHLSPAANTLPVRSGLPPGLRRSAPGSAGHLGGGSRPSSSGGRGGSSGGGGGRGGSLEHGLPSLPPGNGKDVGAAREDDLPLLDPPHGPPGAAAAAAVGSLGNGSSPTTTAAQSPPGIMLSTSPRLCATAAGASSSSSDGGGGGASRRFGLSTGSRHCSSEGGAPHRGAASAAASGSRSAGGAVVAGPAAGAAAAAAAAPPGLQSGGLRLRLLQDQGLPGNLGAAAGGSFSASSSRSSRLPGHMRSRSAMPFASSPGQVYLDSSDGTPGPLSPGALSTVNLGGLQLRVCPTVLAHPAVAIRTNSESSRAVGSRLAALRGPVSPRTQRLLDEVFSASNGDDLIGLGGTTLAMSPDMQEEGDTQGDASAGDDGTGDDGTGDDGGTPGTTGSGDAHVVGRPRAVYMSGPTQPAGVGDAAGVRAPPRVGGEDAVAHGAAWPPPHTSATSTEGGGAQPAQQGEVRLLFGP